MSKLVRHIVLQAFTACTLAASIALLAWPVFVAVSWGISEAFGYGFILDRRDLMPDSLLQAAFLEGWSRSLYISVPVAAIAAVDFLVLGALQPTRILSGITLPIVGTVIGLTHVANGGPRLATFVVCGVALLIVHRFLAQMAWRVRG